MFDAVKEFLNGKKTYLVAVSLVIGALVAWASGEATLAQMVATILEGLGLAALRKGVDKN